MNEKSINSEQENIDHSLQMLKRLRDEWSDEIPEEMISGMSENKLFKVRGNWYQGIVAHAENLLHFAPKDAPQIAEIRELIGYFCQSEEFDQKMATRVDRTDIEKGDRLIKLTLGLFEND